MTQPGLEPAGAPETPGLGEAPTVPALIVEPARREPNSGGAATLTAPGSEALGQGGGLGLGEIEPEERSSDLPSLTPALVERFEGLQFLGRGGMGAVYRAKDRRLGREVALKFLFGNDPRTGRLLLREAQSQARLEHENACKIYEVGVEAGQHYIVMQLIHGEPFDRAKKEMTLEEKVRVVRQVAAALHEAHRLGLVHRDVKPSNIMVEHGEDGAYKPFIMDFGLARDVGEQGQTMTGAIAGTPAFMAPEQATGSIRSLDRRTDVYALGATLYDVLSGRPPFTADSVLRLLQQVMVEDPTPLRKVRPDVPEDLEAIVMKCLEKEPGRRYESARALGDDLQHFLDGEPVQARRASLAYVLLKTAKRHKGRVALGAAALAVASVFGTLWLRERQAAAEQAALSRELGEDVKEMELFLRNAYGLPLHDVERERDLVRQRLRGIEERMAALGRTGEGPASYALGRGFIVLQEPEKALSHLRRASDAGYAPPELRYAMGLALGELYRRALEETKKIQNAERKKAMIAAIEAQYKVPALDHLRAALGARLESPAYVEGLIALYEGRNDVALAKAREAFEKSPWLYEAKKLEGDARFAEGSQWKHDAAFDYDRMMKEFGPAAEAYAAAAAIATSDPAVHEAECELWIQVVLASGVRPASLGPDFEKAKLSCERAVAASPKSGSAYVKTAFAYNAFAWQTVQGPEKQDPEKIIRAAIGRAEEAVRWSSGDAMAHYLVGTTYRTEVSHLIDRGMDARTSIDRAVAGYEEAIRIDPGFLWPYNELCSAYAMRARSEMWRGIDPGPSIDLAVARCTQAIAQDRSFTYPFINQALAHFRRAEYLVDRGQSPAAAIASSLGATAAVRDRNPMGAANLSAWALRIQAAHESDTGRDPSDTLARAEEFVREMEKLAPSSPNESIRGLLETTRALHLVRQGKDPGDSLQRAREAFRHEVEDEPWNIITRVQKAHADIVGLRWALLQGKADAAAFDASLQSLLPFLDKERADPNFHQTIAEVHELRVEWLLAKKQAAEKDWTSGLAMAEKALALNPHMAKALATKGALLLSQARAAKDADARRDAARKAREALAAALRENPLLERERGAALKEAAGLAGE
jgi:serine/threonine-protein kinase